MAPYSVNLEYRVPEIDTNPNIHDVEAEMVYVVDGAGVLTIGGILKDERRTPSRRSRAGWSLRPCTCRGAVRLIDLPLGEDQAVLDPHNVQHAIQVEAGRLDLSADLFLGHALRFV